MKQERSFSVFLPSFATNLDLQNSIIVMELPSDNGSLSVN